MADNSPASASVTLPSVASENRDLLTELELQLNLLGGSVLETDVAGLESFIASQLHEWTGSVGVSSDLIGIFPWLRERRSGDLEEAAELAITRGRLGISFSGSVLIAERTHEDRTLPMLCRRHIILLPAGRVVRQMRDAGPVLHKLTGEGYRYLTFVSGPSRTADIEKILTIGAHGPAELLIVLVRGWEPEDDAPVL